MTHDPTAAGALEQLVHQFSDPLSFYRELIQNSIDAGSTEVEVSLEHTDGVIVIRVDDWGEGMNPEIIDTRLTRLFSSSKDDDLTKIGKFGIGFVSVFAIEPDAVVLDTARDDESWRVIFRSDRSFTHRPRPARGGTKVRILKRGDEGTYDQLLWRTVEVVCFWCRYLEAEIRIQGKPINRPFALKKKLAVPGGLERARDSDRRRLPGGGRAPVRLLQPRPDPARRPGKERAGGVGDGRLPVPGAHPGPRRRAPGRGLFQGHGDRRPADP